MLDMRWTAVLGLALLGLSLSAGSASAFLAYVSNEKGNSISVIDTDKMEMVATIQTGQRPRGIEVSRDGKLVYVAVGDDDKIQVFDAKTFKSAGELPSGADPEQFTIDPAGKILYVANENDAMVTVIDLEKRASVGEVSVGIEPEGMTVSPDGKTLICTSETTSMVHFIDTTTRQIVANLLVGSRPRFSAYKADGSELWVSSEIGGDLAIIDPATRQLKQTVKFEIPGLRSEAIQPVGINITKDGKLGFVELGPANRVAVVDGVTHAVVKYLLVGQRVWHGAFTPDEKYLAGRQRRLERRLRHRRGAPAGHQVDPGRRVAVGYCVRPELKINPPAGRRRKTSRHRRSVRPRATMNLGTRPRGRIRCRVSCCRDNRSSSPWSSMRGAARSTGRYRAARPSCIAGSNRPRRIADTFPRNWRDWRWHRRSG